MGKMNETKPANPSNPNGTFVLRFDITNKRSLLWPAARNVVLTERINLDTENTTGRKTVGLD